MKKVLCIILSITFMFCFCAGAQDYTAEADELYNLGLFKGTDVGYELDKVSTRAEAVTMIARLLGQEHTVYTGNAVFEDVPDNHWSYNYVMYCFENGITKGTGATTFSPNETIDSNQFIALILRVLGYDAEPETAASQASFLGFLPPEYTAGLGESFVRGDMVHISYTAYNFKCFDGGYLKDKIAGSGKSETVGDEEKNPEAQTTTEKQTKELEKAYAKDYNSLDEMIDGFFGN